MEMKYATKMLALSTTLALAVGTAGAQQFSDDFNTGSLAAWGNPFVLNNPITNQFVSAAGGALRMSGVGSVQSGAPEILVLPLASSEVQPLLYLNGTASVDVKLDPFSTAGMFARGASFAPGNETGVSMGVSARPLQGISNLFIEVVVNGNVTTLLSEIVPYDFTNSRITASWSGDGFVFTVTSLADPLQSASLFATDSGLSGIGGSFGLGTARSAATVFEFGALFDNFTIVPAPGATAILTVGGLMAARRRR